MPPPSPPPRTNHSKDGRTYAAILLAALQLSCNAGILFATIQTHQFGAHILKDNWWISWWISDHNVISIVEFFSKVLVAITALLAGWASSQFWGRRLCDPGSSAGIAELQSLDAFNSIITVPKVINHVARNHYISVRKLYGLLAVCAILLHPYSTALVTLVTPVVHPIEDSSGSYSFNRSDFMTNYGYNDPCFSYEDDPSGKETCLSRTLVASAQEDIQNYDSSYRFTEPSQYTNGNVWRESWINYNFITVIVGHIYFGLIDNSSQASGVAMYGINAATAEAASRGFALDDDDDNELPSLWDSVDTRVQVDTTIPVLTSQCIQENTTADTSSITIRNDTFLLPIPVPSLDDGQIVTQMASDNATFVLSLGAINGTSKKHCAIHLFFQNTTLDIFGGSIIPYSLVPTQIYIDQASNPWDYGVFTDWTQNGQYLTTFSRAWSEGMGWSVNPSTSSLTKLLSKSPILADSPLKSKQSHDPLEFYTLVLLSSGISAAFPREVSVGKSNHRNISTRNYTVIKEEYYIGFRSPLRSFLMFIIVFDSIFVLGCLIIIMQQGWHPDWADPTILLCAALQSHSNKLDSDEDKHLLRVKSNGTLFPASNMWKVSFTLEETKDGDVTIAQSTWQTNCEGSKDHVKREQEQEKESNYILLDEFTSTRLP